MPHNGPVAFAMGMPGSKHSRSCGYDRAVKAPRPLASQFDGSFWRGNHGQPGNALEAVILNELLDLGQYAAQFAH